MIKDPRSHAAHQSFSRHKALEDIPDLRRAHYFINGLMTDAEREAKQVAKLRPTKGDAAKLGVDVDRLLARLRDQSTRLTKSKVMFEALHETLGDDAPRARVVKNRSRVLKNRDQSDASKENKR